MTVKEHLTEFKQELKTHLQHLAGCRSLILADAQQKQNEDLNAFLEIMSSRTAMIEDSISHFLKDKPERNEDLQAEDLKTTLTSPFLEIRGACKEFLKTLQKSRHLYLQDDIDLVVTSVDRILDFIEEQISYIFFDPAGENVPSLAGLAATEEKEEKPELSAHQGTILIVDDTDMNRFLLSRHLGRQGHNIIEAKSGLEAITLLQDKKVDLVLLDVMMPGMNGYQVLEILKADAHFRDIPVVMLSAYEDEKSIVRCIELGAEDYLSKAFNPVFLKARIESSLEKKHLHDQEKYYLEALQESQKRLMEDLSEASQYVTSLLPVPISEPLRIDWNFFPSAQLGGDSFGYHRLDEKTFALYLLDVSGHGIGAALLSVSVLNILRNHALQDADFSDPGSVLSSLNRKFRMEDQNNMYFTIWYGVFCLDTGKLRYACAGAPPGVLLAEEGGKKETVSLKAEGTAVGISDEAEYENKERSIRPGERLYLFSDGAYEIRKKDSAVLELEDFTALLAETADRQGKDLSALDSIIKQLKELGTSSRFEDDLSLIEIRFPG